MLWEYKLKPICTGQFSYQQVNYVPFFPKCFHLINHICFPLHMRKASEKLMICILKTIGTWLFMQVIVNSMKKVLNEISWHLTEFPFRNVMWRSRSESTTVESTRLLEAVPKLRALADDGSEPDNVLPFSFLWEYTWIGFSFFFFFSLFWSLLSMIISWDMSGCVMVEPIAPKHSLLTRYTANLLRLRRINWNFPKKWHIHGDKQLFYVVQACNMCNFVVPICPVGVLEHEQNKHIQIPCVEQEPLD